MARWIAIGRLERWQDLDLLRADLTATEKWRLDARTSVSEVVVLEDGRFVAECQGPDQAIFTAWLDGHGCAVESLAKMSAVARTGEAWRV